MIKEEVDWLSLVVGVRAGRTRKIRKRATTPTRKTIEVT
jgi:hypothetical protein